MRIKKVRFKNGYKRFRDLTIDLGDNPARIVALVGPNGSGKSSVLDGMLFHQNTHDQIGQHQTRDTAYHSMELSAPVSYKDIEITFIDGSYTEMRIARDKVGKHMAAFVELRDCIFARA